MMVAKTTPRASIIIVNHNGGRHLENCLRSLLSEERRDYEVIVVDNASTDGSAQRVEQAFPQVRLIQNEVNLGFGQGNNVGAVRAKGEYLAFLNPDTLVEPGWLEALIAAVASSSRTGLATSKILLLADHKRINTCGNNVHCSGLTLCRGMGMDRDALDGAADVGAVSGAAFVARRDVFAQLGGFDETFFLYMEDTDLSWRARLAGYRCVYVPRSIVYHDYTLRFGPRKTFYQERNRYLMLLKSLRWRTLLALLPTLLLAEVVTWGFVLLRERRHQGNKLLAYVWVVRHWRQVLEARRRVQRLRKARDRDLIARCACDLAFEQTGDGMMVKLARMAFNPMFFALHRLALGLIRW